MCITHMKFLYGTGNVKACRQKLCQVNGTKEISKYFICLFVVAVFQYVKITVVEFWFGMQFMEGQLSFSFFISRKKFTLISRKNLSTPISQITSGNFASLYI